MLHKRTINEIKRDLKKGLSGASKGCDYNVNKKKIIDYLEETEFKDKKYTKKELKEIIDAFLSAISVCTEAGACVTFARFGSFKKKTTKATTKKLSKKQQEMLGVKKKKLDVPAKIVAKFTASKKFFEVKIPKRKK